MPAPAQGAIALETRCTSSAIAACAPADVPASRAAVTAERAVLAGLGGGCLVPLGAWARLEGEALVVTAALAGEDGVRRAKLGGDPRDAAAIGARTAGLLR